MKKILIPVFAALLLSSTVTAQRETRFFTSFEYGSLDAEPDSPTAPGDLDGADGQVGTWEGDELPDAVGGDILEQPNPMGFKNNPYDGGRILVVDRPGPSLDDGISDARGTLNAVLSSPTTLVGSEVSFQLGTRRTNGSNNNKDYDIIGRDSDGNESFRMRVGTNNSGLRRLGYVLGDAVVFDLPTVVGDDSDQDMNNTGFNAGIAGPYEDDLGGPGVNTAFPSIKLSLGMDSWVINLAHNEQSTAGFANTYTSDNLPYNGNASDLAQVEFEWVGSSATGRSSGWFLDNVLVTGFDEFIQGDFDFSGAIDVADFNILLSNFGEETSDGDFDLNGIVNLADFAQLRLAFESAAGGVASVPEPSGVSLLIAGWVGLLFTRRRSR